MVEYNFTELYSKIKDMNKINIGDKGKNEQGSTNESFILKKVI